MTWKPSHLLLSNDTFQIKHFLKKSDQGPRLYNFWNYQCSVCLPSQRAAALSSDTVMSQGNTVGMKVPRQEVLWWLPLDTAESMREMSSQSSLRNKKVKQSFENLSAQRDCCVGCLFVCFKKLFLRRFSTDLNQQ